MILTAVLKSKNPLGLSTTTLFLAAALWIFAPLSASAQFQQPNNLVQQIPPGESFATPLGPPPGSGTTPTALIGGDNTIGPAPVASGQADTTTGNSFPSGTGSDRSVVHVYRNVNGALGSRGNRMTMTIRGDQLSADALSAINGILGINMENGQQVIDVVASDAQIEQINQALAAWPQYQMENNRKKINSDSPATGYPKANETNAYDFQGPLPTVRVFSRYLVILGVVSATIFMALAAYSMVLGHPYGGARVIGTAAGFMLLLMGYTIWKIVQMNTFHANTNTAVVNQNRPTTDQVTGTLPNPSPITPTTAARGARSGIPVQPDSGN